MDTALADTDDALFAEHEDLLRLRTALTRARRFALLFAVCNAPSYRNRLTKALQNALARPIVRVHLKPIEDNPTMDVQIADALAEAPPDAAVFVFGLENLMPLGDGEKQFNALRQLNWRRAAFGRLACPVVFWLPDYALTLIANEAPDFHDWYSGVYLFPVPAAAAPDAMQKTMMAAGDFGAVSGLSFAEKQRWRETLEELVMEPRGDTPAEQANLADLLNRLGNLAAEMADYPAAKDYFTRALRINETAYGTEHPEVAADIGNLGNVLYLMGDFEGAKAAHERALRIDEAAYGTEHPEVAADVGNLGVVLYNMGDFDGAKAAYERALQINEAAYGAQHPEVARNVYNLGNVLRNMGDFDGAKAAYERALQINEAAYGAQHPAVAINVGNLGIVLADMGDFEGAKAAYERALRIDEAAYGAQHPAVARNVYNLGNVLRNMGDFEGAKAAFERALQINEAAFGTQHPTTQQTERNLAFTLAAMEDAKE